MRVLVTGASGFVGSHVIATLAARGHAPLALTRGLADLAVPGAGAAAVERLRPDAIVHLAALADIAPCRADPGLARRLNAGAADEIARAAAGAGARLVHVSTDQVFDGSRGFWREADDARPLHAYGATKLEGESRVAARVPAAAIVRPGLVTGVAPAGRRSASSGLLAALARGECPRLFTDEFRTPVAVLDLAAVLADLVERPEAHGLLHCGGGERLSRWELGQREALAAGFDPGRLVAASREEGGLADERPADLSLDDARLVALLGWRPRALAR